jgi:hypothetical protein
MMNDGCLLSGWLAMIDHDDCLMMVVASCKQEVRTKTI